MGMLGKNAVPCKMLFISLQGDLLYFIYNFSAIKEQSTGLKPILLNIYINE